MTVTHPAKYSNPVLDVFSQHLKPGWRVLDPFAGVGRLAEIKHINAFCVEIEPEWATQVVADAFYLPFRANCFDAIAVSPVYGNRMSDHHDARDTSKRYTYKHCLGRDLHPRNSGRLQWGDAYRLWHTFAWDAIVRTLAPGGDFLLNSSDHIRGGEVQEVTAFHEQCLRQMGLEVVHRIPIATRRLRHGVNRDARVAHETVTVLRKGR